MRATWAEQLRRVREVNREGGARLVLRKAAARLACDVRVYAFDLDREVAMSGLEVVALAPHEVHAYLELRPDEDEATVRARLERGDLCFVSWDGPQVIGGVWARFERMWVSELGEALPLRAGDAYGYASFTHPGRRGLGTATARIEALIRELRRRGYARLVGYVVGDNAAGIPVVEKLRFACVGHVRWFHLGRLGLDLRSGEASPPRTRVHVRPREGE